MPPKRMPVVYGIDFGHQFTKIAASRPNQAAHGKDPLYSEASVCYLPGMETTLVQTTVEYKNNKPTIGRSPEYSAPGDGAISRANQPSSNATSEDKPELKLEGVQRWFKLEALSQDDEKETGRKKSSRDAPKLAGPTLRVLEDFLGGLLQEIRQFHDQWAADKNGPPSWHETDIDFIFSVPSIVNESGATVLQEIAKRAGFASPNHRHRVPSIELTEAEAAGVHGMTLMNGLMSVGDTALVIDVGGGTTDFSMLTLTGKEQWKLDNNFLMPVSSNHLGGAHIDEVIGGKMVRCLKAVAETGTDVETISKGVNSLQSGEKYHNRKFLCQTWDKKVNFPAADPALVQQLPKKRAGDDVCLTGPNLRFHVQAPLFARLLDTKIHGTSLNPGIVSHAVTMRDDLAVRSPSQSRQYDEINDIPRDCKGDPNKPDTLDFVFFAGGLGPAPRLMDAVRGALTPKPDDFRLKHTMANTQYKPLDKAQHAVALGLVEHWTGKLENASHDHGLVWSPWLRRFGRK